jgi:hypothetical protein
MGDFSSGFLKKFSLSLSNVNDNYLTLSGQEITVGTVPISLGGTNATTAEQARTNLGIGEGGGGGTSVTLATVTDNYLTLSGQEITANTVPVSLGGTGATTAAAARSALVVDIAGTDNSTAVTLANTNYLTISGQEITAGTVPVSSGGTNATTAAAARTALGVDAAGMDNSTDVTLANTNYLSISGQEITAGTVPVSSGGTGATTAAAARTALGAASSTNNSTDVTLATVTGNYLTITGQEITVGKVPLSLGGTGAGTAADARTALGVDAAGIDNSTPVTLATVTGNYLTLSGQEITVGKVPLSLGGTGAGTAADACNNLGIGENNNVRFKSIGVGVNATGTDGEIIATNDITAFHSSDKRLKTNIQTIQDPLTKLQKIGGYTFDWIPIQGIHSNTGNDVGVIAQEIEEILPEVTTTRDNGYKAVRYEKLTPLLIECIKSQQSQIDELHDRLSKIEKKIN